MNYKNILKVSVAVLASLAVLAGCAKKEEFKEITELVLSRCLEPQNLTARVDVATGDIVTFGWDVNKDAQIYELSLYTDAERTQLEKTWELEAAQIPFSVRLTADQKYWFTVSAFKADPEGEKVASTQSKLAVYESDGGIKTYAVKDNLFLEVSGRTATSLSLAWSNEVSDYQEVTELRAVPVTGGSTVKKELTDAESTAAAATIEGLVASTEYQVTLFYMSASRGTVDTWTLAEQGEKVSVNTSAALVTAANAGGSYYLSYSDDVYTMSAAKPVTSLTVVGELSADGKKPTVQGSFDISSILASGSSLRFENIHFADNGNTGHLITFSAGPLTMDKIEFVNCEITGFKSGLFYNNKDGGLTVGEITFDSCDIYDILGSGGDGFDLRKPTDITTLKFVNCTIYDGFRTFMRIDAVEGIKIGTIDFENNTVKNVATVDDGNNRGFFAIRVASNMTLKNNLFLWEDGGKTGEADVDKAQLFQENAGTVVPTLTASDNWSYAQGKSFFTKVPAANAGFKIINVDPCYNSKGNFFQLAAQDLISGKVGASKWWISYVEKPEDLTQNVLPGAHVWNLQDASLFAGEVKNSRVRDELLLVGTEATPLNADGAINFEKATVLSKKGVPEEGYLSFKVNTPGSVDMLVANGGASSVVVALYDDNGFAVQGGIMTPYVAGVQKVVIPKVTGEGTVYIYATGAITLSKLAWSLDVLAGNPVLATPKPVVEPVTLTEGDATEVAVTWDAIDNAASYVVVFNKRIQPAQTELSFTVPAEDIAALKAGLYSFTVQALPAADDIYYTKSDQGVASIAIQPKGGSEKEPVTLSWDFSDADWVAKFESSFSAINTNEKVSFDLNGLYVIGVNTLKYNKTDAGVYFLQMGGKGKTTERAFSFTAPFPGTLKVWATNTGDSDDLTRTVAVVVNGGTPDALPGGYAKKDGPHELEYNIAEGGSVIVYGPDNGLCFYKLEYTYVIPDIEYDWNFSDADWVAKFESSFSAINTNEKVSFDLNGLNVIGVNTLKYNKTEAGVYFLQMGGKGKTTERAFKFDAPDAGTLKVWATNTGDSDDLTRTVAVVLNDGTPDALPGGYAKKDGPHELEYSISGPGTVIIYGPDNGLCFYEIAFTNKK